MPHTILVVDDEALARSLLRLILVRDGYRVREAVDGLDALEKIAEEMPDLVLLDVLMPKLDGFETCRRLRQDEATSDLPIIFLSAQIDEESRRRGMDAGANEYIVKPISAEAVLGTIRAHLGATTES